MINLIKKISVSLFLLFLTFGCTQIEQHYHKVKNKHWDYKDSINFEVNIEQPGAFNYYILLRHGNNYPYSNIWIKSAIYYPDNESFTTKYPLTLANNSGFWLGQGPGNIIDNRFLVIPHLQLSKPGKYIFTLKQDMRDDSLQGIDEVGIRLKRIDPTD